MLSRKNRPSQKFRRTLGTDDDFPSGANGLFQRPN